MGIEQGPRTASAAHIFVSVRDVLGVRGEVAADEAEGRVVDA